jgi:hypothetical protein
MRSLAEAVAGALARFAATHGAESGIRLRANKQLSVWGQQSQHQNPRRCRPNGAGEQAQERVRQVVAKRGQISSIPEAQNASLVPHLDCETLNQWGGRRRPLLKSVVRKLPSRKRRETQ